MDFPAPVDPPTTMQKLRVHLIQARQKVVVGLADDVVPSGTRPTRVRELELEPERGEVVAVEPAQGVGKPGSQGRGSREDGGIIASIRGGPVRVLETRPIPDWPPSPSGSSQARPHAYEHRRPTGQLLRR